LSYESGGYGKIGENETNDDQVDVWCLLNVRVKQLVLNSTVDLALNALQIVRGMIYSSN